MRAAAVLVVLVVGALVGACAGSSPIAATPVANVVVVGGTTPPVGLPGLVINTGTPGGAVIPLTCTPIVCVQVIQIQNTGTECASNTEGTANVFQSPVSLTSLLATSNFPVPVGVIAPGQIVTVNVGIVPPATNYLVTAVLNWTNIACPTS